MRPIKFRLWDKVNKRMVEKPSVLFPDHRGFFWTADPRNKWLSDMEAELMQFTGLLDKNGKDIYEGDILEWSVWPDEEGNAKRIRDSIEFRHGAFATSQRYQLLATLEPHRTLEIVGNIYENPDLVPSE